MKDQGRTELKNTNRDGSSDVLKGDLENTLKKLIARLEYNEQKKSLDKREKKSIIREFLSKEDF